MENNHSRTWPPTAHTRSQSSSTGPSAMSDNIWWVYVDQQRTRNALSKRSLTASRCLASVQETSMPSSPQPWVKDISRTMRFTVPEVNISSYPARILAGLFFFCRAEILNSGGFVQKYSDQGVSCKNIGQ